VKPVLKLNLDILIGLNLWELFYSTDVPEFKNLYEKEPICNGERFGPFLSPYMIHLLCHWGQCSINLTIPRSAVFLLPTVGS